MPKESRKIGIVHLAKNAESRLNHMQDGLARAWGLTFREARSYLVGLAVAIEVRKMIELGEFDAQEHLHLLETAEWFMGREEIREFIFSGREEEE